MKRLRAQLARLGPAVAALFALSVAVPGTTLLYHQHPGGEHAHVHPDYDSAIADLLADYWHDHKHADDASQDHAHPGHHHDHLTVRDPRHPTSSNAMLARDEGSATGHCHQQDRFHRALIAGAPFIPAVGPAGAAAQPAPALSVHVAARNLRARAPPRSWLSQEF